MNRAKLLRLSTRLAKSLSSTQQLGLSSFSSAQVNRFSQLTHSPPFHAPSNRHTRYNYLNLHQKLFFCSKPESFIDLLCSSSDWSEEIENELKTLNPKLTHESVVYVLMKLNRNPQKSLDFFKWVCVRKGFDPSYVPYAILLKSLACKDFVTYFWDVAYELKEKGFHIDKQVYRAVDGVLRREKLNSVAAKWAEFYKTLCAIHDVSDASKDVVDLLLECDWSEEVEGKLKKKLNPPFSESFVLRVIGELWKQPLRALKLFEWVSSYGGYKHDSVTYNAMLKVLAQDDSVGEFWDVVERMRNEGYEVDIDTYVKVSRQEYLPIEDAVKLFELMMDGPYKPSATDCNLLLKRVSYEYEAMDLVERVVNKYVAAGFTKTKSIYDGVHRILCRIGKLEEAEKIVEEMRSAGYEPDNITYSQEVFGLCKEKRLDEAFKVLDRMEAEGCTPDIKTWTILLQGYCVANQVDQALSCFAKMIERNVNPDADTVEVLLHGFLSENKLLGAYTFLVEMINKACVKPWQATYKFMIEKLTEDGRSEEAVDLLRLMKHQGYPPFADPIAQYISKSGTVEDAKKLLQALTVKDFPSTSAYIRVIRSFFEAGRESEARDLASSSPYNVRSHKDIRNMLGWGLPNRRSMQQ